LRLTEACFLRLSPSVSGSSWLRQVIFMHDLIFV